MTKKIISLVLSLVVILSLTGGVSVQVAEAKKDHQSGKHGGKSQSKGKKHSKKSVFSKKKIVVSVGGRATVRVKKTKKKMHWSVSNKKTAKITGFSRKSVTVKGIKKGSAKLIAKVGKKKYTCKIVVTKKKEAAIRSVKLDPLDNSVLEVSFAKPVNININELKIQSKDYKKGIFNISYKVNAVSAESPSIYRFYLNNNVSQGDIVKINMGKINEIFQIKSGIIPEPDKNIRTILVEKDDTVNIDTGRFFRNTIASAYYSLEKKSKLPKGLALYGKRGLIKGIPTESGESKFTLNVKDEVGETAKIDLIIKVYDDANIKTADIEKGIIFDDFNEDRINNDAFIKGQAVDRLTKVIEYPGPSQTPTVILPSQKELSNAVPDTYTVIPASAENIKGGSGTYYYSLVDPAGSLGLTTDPVPGTPTEENPNPTPVPANPSASTGIKIPFNFSETKTFTINVTDAADASKTAVCNVTVTVNKRSNVSGIVKDAAGGSVAGNPKLYFYPVGKSYNSYDYEKLRTFRRYYRSRDEFGFEKQIAIAGNNRNDYGYADNDLDGDMFYDLFTFDGAGSGEESMSGLAGPMPIPEIMRGVPTAAPVAVPVASGGVPLPSDASQVTMAPANRPMEIKLADLAAGQFETQLAPGEYIVKVGGIDGVRYQMNGTVKIEGDTNSLEISLPTSFSNVSGIASYANGGPITNKYLYFENTNNIYEEWSSFHTQTDYTGKFNVSLPAGSYNAFVYVDGKKEYFQNPVVVTSSGDIVLGDFRLSVSRTSLTGILKKAVNLGVDVQTGVPKAVAAPLSYKNIYFYNRRGERFSARTDGGTVGYDQTGNPVYPDTYGKYDVTLKADTYLVRMTDNDSIHTIGQIVVNDVPTQQADLIYSWDTEKAVPDQAPMVADASGVFSYSAMAAGNNDLITKFTIAVGGTYEFDIRQSGNPDGVAGIIYDPEGKMISSLSNPTYTRRSGSRDGKDDTLRVTKTLSPGDYYIRILTNETGDYDEQGRDGNVNAEKILAQVKGAVSLNIYPYREAFSEYGDGKVLPVGAAVTIDTDSRHKDSRMENTGYFRATGLAAGTRYMFTVKTTTISDSGDDPIREFFRADTMSDIAAKSTSVGNVYYFTPSESRDYYFGIKTSSTANLTVRLDVAPVVEGNPTATVSPDVEENPVVTVRPDAEESPVAMDDDRR